MTDKLDSFSSIPTAFFDMAQSHSSLMLYEQAVNVDSGSGDSNWKATSYSECAYRIEQIASFLVKQGIEKGDKVAIISQSRPEWMEADIAILSVCGVSVSVYQSLPADDIGYILFDSGAKIVFVENQEQIDKINWLRENKIKIAATEDRLEQEVTLSFKQVISFEMVEPAEGVTHLSKIFEIQANFDHSIYSDMTRDDLAALVYTSGTTGPPKGVMQTHGNHLSNCRQAWNAKLLKQGDSIFVFLPLAHSFAKLMGYLGFLSAVTLKFPSIASNKTSNLDPNIITRDIREGSATIVPIVPRLLEKMQGGITARSKGSSLQAKIVNYTLWSAKKIYEASASDKSASLTAQIAYFGLVGIRKKIQQQLFGSNFKYAISGGAKLSTDTSRFFDMLSIEVCEGYGLTETCVATNVNRPGKKRIGTVGPVLDHDIELQIAEDSEILYRGPNITQGYYQRPTATNESWDADGWFHTGDLGAVDADGFLSIVGRKKEILVTSYGKNVAPEGIEAAVKASQYISQAVLVGDGRPFCICLVTLDYPVVKSWADKIPIELELDSAHTNSRVMQLIDSEIELVNQDLARHEAIKKVVILAGDFSIDNGFLTPTFKVKKRKVLQEYAREIADAYQGHS